MAVERRDCPPALVAEAKRQPGGWVYEIAGKYGPDDPVPPTAIRGAWKVDKDGEIIDDFLPNPNYRPSGSSQVTNHYDRTARLSLEGNIATSSIGLFNFAQAAIL